MDNDNKDLGFRDFLSVSEMYQKWYIDYASYVILERAIPRFEDGLKPVQRRILHAMHNIDDGRFHKVANVIGQTMQYHPHGDAAINDALVGIGQKNLLIENFSDPTEDYLFKNPAGFFPVLNTSFNENIVGSLVIVEYLQNLMLPPTLMIKKNENEIRRCNNHTTLRVQYIVGECAEDDFKHLLQMHDIKRKKLTDLNNIYQLFSHAANDIVNNFIAKFTEGLPLNNYNNYIFPKIKHTVKIDQNHLLKGNQDYWEVVF